MKAKSPVAVEAAGLFFFETTPTSCRRTAVREY